MCGRYSNVKTMNQLGIEFGAQLGGGVRESAPNLDVRPTTQVPFLQARLGEDGTVRRELSVGLWGMIPTFAKAFESNFATFNARSEDVGDKPTFRASVPRWRAAVPATAYAEWKKSGPKRTDPKQRYEIAPADGGGTIAFAGLYAPWRNPTVEDESHPDAWLLSCTILTMPAPPLDSGQGPPWRSWARCMTGCPSRWPPARLTPGWTRGTRTALACWISCAARRTTSPQTGTCGPSNSSRTRTDGSAWKQWIIPSSEAA
ncbi:SOS response-associated peptidase family protein [Arthrobacter sp. NPDC080073]|uniref:SOS response-associated peptidase n=1 Tax=Arthrobacter sp. NPDC080073 TaxID=3155919 RepID=UPI003412EDCF